MIFHKKEETPEGDIIVKTEEGTQIIGKRKRKPKKVDDDGFEITDWDKWVKFFLIVHLTTYMSSKHWGS